MEKGQKSGSDAGSGVGITPPLAAAIVADETLRREIDAEIRNLHFGICEKTMLAVWGMSPSKILLLQTRETMQL